MKKLLQSIFLLLTFTTWSYAQPPILYFDFEDAGNEPSFTDVGATWDGVVDNPLSDAVNNSAKVGKSSTGSNIWDGIKYDFGSTLDLSKDSIFSMKVYHPTLTGETRLQFEYGGTQVKIDVMYNTPGEWAELEFKIPKTHDDKITAVVLCFAHDRGDAGEEWYFDDLRGTEYTPDLPDVLYFDFESSTPTFTGVGATFDGVVDNPIPDGTNSSTKVGKSSTGSNIWDGIKYEFDKTLDLSTDSVFTMMVYHPTLTGETRLQFEYGGTQVKIDVMYDTPGEWALLSFPIPKVHDDLITAVVLCFAHDRGDAGEEWYFDDLRGTKYTPASGDVPPVMYFDFEGDGTKPEITDGGASYGGVVANPDKSGLNMSDSVGMVVTGSFSWDGVGYRFKTSINLSETRVFTMLVYHPDSTCSFRLHFNNLDELKLNVDYTTPGEWQLLTWEIPISYEGDIESVLIVPAHNRSAEGEEWYFDELRGPVYNKVYPPRTYYNTASWRQDWTGFSEAVYEDVVDNPDPAVGNKWAGKFMTGSTNWAGITMSLPSKIDFSETENFTMNVYSDSVGFVRVQLEEDGGAQLKISVPYTTPGEWQELEFNASDGTGSPATDNFYDKLTLIFDDKDADLGEEWYFDMLMGPKIANIDPVMDYFDLETAETTPDFIDVTWDDMVFIGIVDNPSKDAVDESDSVGLVMTGSATWYYVNYLLPTPVSFNNGHTFTMKVFCADSSGNARIQLDADGGKNLKLSEPYTTPGEWQEITFDAYHVIDNSTGTVFGPEYYNVKLIFDDTDTDLAEPWYFDDLRGPELMHLYEADAIFHVVGYQTDVTNYEIEINNSGEKLMLYNDGTNGDEVAGDSLFSLTVEDLPTGDHTYSVYADGSLIGSGTDVPFTVKESMWGTDVFFTHDLTAVKMTTDSQFMIYPNPTSDMLAIDGGSNKIFELVVYNIHGAIVKSQVYVGVNYVDLNVSDLISGLYFIKVNNGSGSAGSIARFIKK